MHPQHSRQVWANLISHRYPIALEPCNLPTESAVCWARMPSLSPGLCHSYFTGKETKDPGGPLALHPSSASTGTNLNPVTDRNKSKWCPPPHTRTGSHETSSYPSSFRSKAPVPKNLCPGLGRRHRSPPTGGPRGRSWSHAGRREYPTLAGCGCRGCGARSPVGYRFCICPGDHRQPLQDTPRRDGAHSPGRRRVALGLGPGLGVPRHPHPRQSWAAEPEPGSAARRGRAVWGRRWELGSTSQSSESWREGPRAPSGGAAHLPTLRHRAGIRTPGRSRLVGLALRRVAQCPGPSTLRQGGGCLGGHLRGNKSWESLPPHLAVNSPSCARRPPLSLHR